MSWSNSDSHNTTGCFLVLVRVFYQHRIPDENPNWFIHIREWNILTDPVSVSSESFLLLGEHFCSFSFVFLHFFHCDNSLYFLSLSFLWIRFISMWKGVLCTRRQNQQNSKQYVRVGCLKQTAQEMLCRACCNYCQLEIRNIVLTFNKWLLEIPVVTSTDWTDAMRKPTFERRKCKSAHTVNLTVINRVSTSLNLSFPK